MGNFGSDSAANGSGQRNGYGGFGAGSGGENIAPTINTTGVQTQLDQSDAARAQQEQALAETQAMAQGKGPSAASAMLQQNANQSMANQNAMASSGSGSAGAGMARRSAMMANANTMQNLGGQAATARAQEQMGAIASQGQQAQAIRGQDQGGAQIYGQVATNQAELDQKNQALNAQIGESQGAANDKVVGGFIGGALSALGGVASAAADMPVGESHLMEPGGQSHWVLREEPDFILAKNMRTGELRKLLTAPLTPEEHHRAMAPHGAGPLPHEGQKVHTDPGVVDRRASVSSHADMGVGGPAGGYADSVRRQHVGLYADMPAPNPSHPRQMADGDMGGIGGVGDRSDMPESPNHYADDAASSKKGYAALADGDLKASPTYSDKVYAQYKSKPYRDPAASDDDMEDWFNRTVPGHDSGPRDEVAFQKSPSGQDYIASLRRSGGPASEFPVDGYGEPDEKDYNALPDYQVERRLNDLSYGEHVREEGPDRRVGHPAPKGESGGGEPKKGLFSRFGKGLAAFGSSFSDGVDSRPPSIDIGVGYHGDADMGGDDAPHVANYDEGRGLKLLHAPDVSWQQDRGWKRDAPTQLPEETIGARPAPKPGRGSNTTDYLSALHRMKLGILKDMSTTPSLDKARYSGDEDLSEAPKSALDAAYAKITKARLAEQNKDRDDAEDQKSLLLKKKWEPEGQTGSVYLTPRTGGRALQGLTYANFKNVPSEVFHKSEPKPDVTTYKDMNIGSRVMAQKFGGKRRSQGRCS